MLSTGACHREGGRWTKEEGEVVALMQEVVCIIACMQTEGTLCSDGYFS